MITNVVTIARIYMKWALRNPLTYIFMICVMPLSILVPLSLLASRALIVDVITGGMLFSVVMGGISDMSQNISFDRQTKRLTFLITRPVLPFEYLLGMSIGGLCYNIVGSLLVFLFAFLTLSMKFSAFAVVETLTLLVVAWFISSCIGFVIGLYGPKDYRTNSAIANILAFAFTFLAPIYYPIDAIPSPIRPLSYVVYTTHIAMAIKAVITGQPVMPFNILMIFIFLIVFLGLSRAGIKWRVK
jgi:ABC-2 type transport system permease protein